MAGCLLIVFIIYFFQKIQAQALLPPELTVNPAVITATDSVTLNCQPPSSVSVSRCYFYTLSGGTVRDFTCLKTLTGTELLKMSRQKSPADVNMRCYYTVKIGEKMSQSPYSEKSSITIHTLLPPELTVNPAVITETDSVTLNCQPPSSVSVSQCYFNTLSGGIVREFSCLQTLTGTELLKMSRQRSSAEVQVVCFYTVKLGEKNYPSPYSETSSITIHSLTVSRSSSSTLATTVKLTDIVEKESSRTPTMPTFSTTTGLTVSRSSSSTLATTVKLTTGQTVSPTSTSTSLTSVKPASETWIWKSVAVVAGCGVTVGIVLLVSAALSNKRRTGSEEVKRESQDENFEVYHLYATVTEEPAASDLCAMYSTVQKT